MSDEVDESEGVMYSFDGARWNVSKLLQPHETLLIPLLLIECFVLTSIPELAWFAAVKSQWRLMKRGISEKARKR